MLKKPVTAVSRITFGLVCSMLGILMGADVLGLLPDRDAMIVSGRAQLAEAMAFNATAFIAADDMGGLSAVLQSISDRQDQILSMGVRRRSDQSLVATTTEHAALWPEIKGDESDSQFMQIRLSRAGDKEWGRIEFVFRPLHAKSWISSLRNPMLELLLYAGVVGFVAFRLFLRIVLKNLDPSRAVPRRVREALDILTEGLLIVGLDDRILLANKAFAQTVRRDRDGLIGKKTVEFGFRRRDGEPSMPWTETRETRLPVSGVTMDFSDDQGHARVFKVNCSPLSGNEGHLRGIMISLDDVTVLEQKKVELKLAKDAADAANKAKSDFLANMSHEIRNPMNAIVGFTDVLRRGLEESEETRTTYLDTIHASGTHLVELINDILDFSKIEAGKLELEVRECSPYQIMTEVVNVLKMKADQQSLDLTFFVQGAIPETIQSDPTRLRQILMNLVGNAIKFTTEGHVRIAASMIKQDGKSLIRFEVTDTGIGMTSEQTTRLFQEFMQADSSVTRRFGGTGLGLAISKRLAEALGGKISVDSEPGVGSTFQFCVETGDLTGVAILNDREASEKFRSASRTKTHRPVVCFRPARVLVTDDTPANRQLVGLVLRKAGLEVDEAENGEVAVTKASSGSYDLLLMDMQMPVLDGFSATRMLREQGLRQPIVALTANVTEQDRQQCQAAGCTGFLSKPINIDLLLNTLAEYLPTQTETGSTTQTLNFLDDVLGQLSSGQHEIAGSPALLTEMRPNDSARTILQPIRSTLPLTIPEFRTIVESFVGGLDQTVGDLRAAQHDRNFQEIREIAHRLKGTGGTVGFSGFTEPCRKLQNAAEQRDEAKIEAMLCEVEEICSRIVSPDPAPCDITSQHACH